MRRCERSREPEPPDNSTSPDSTDDENDALKSLSADPWPGETFAEVAVGFSHACALYTAGAISCFGSGNLEAPQGDGYSNLDAGSMYMCATTSSGEIACW